MQKVLLLINQSANDGYGVKKWKKIKKIFYNISKSEKIDEVSYSPPFNLVPYLNNKEYNKIIFGGGDGTFHYGINAWLNLSDRNPDIVFGAIGLGSSNDLHKPFSSFIEKVPVRINRATYKHDIGKVIIKSKYQIRDFFFIINASLGVTAFGNYLFNNPDWILNMLKSKCINISIIYTALKSILLYKNLIIEIDYGNGYVPIIISSVNIIKSPHITGGLYFDQIIKPDDGFLGIHICENMNKYELIKTFIDLTKGKFSGKPKRTSNLVRTVRIKSKEIVPIELDGEIYFGNEFIIELMPKHLNILV